MSPLDSETVLARFAGVEATLVLPVLARFGESAASDRAAIARLASDDPAAAARVAHGLHGSALAVGAQDLAREAARVEADHKAGTPAELAELDLLVAEAIAAVGEAMERITQADR